MLAKENLAAARTREVAAWQPGRRHVSSSRPVFEIGCRCVIVVRERVRSSPITRLGIRACLGDPPQDGESVERAAKAAAMVGNMPHIPRFDGRAWSLCSSKVKAESTARTACRSRTPCPVKTQDYKSRSSALRNTADCKDEIRDLTTTANRSSPPIRTANGVNVEQPLRVAASMRSPN